MDIEIRINGESLVKMDVNAELLSQIVSLKSEILHADKHARSTPLTVEQAHELLSKVDAETSHFLNRIAANHGWVTWGETLHTFGIRRWIEFVNGPKKKLTATLRHLVHNHSAQLVWRDEHDWEGLDEGTDEICKLYVDGAALRALRTATGAAA